MKLTLKQAAAHPGCIIERAPGAVYGLCPICMAEGHEIAGVWRERRFNGNDKCDKGHVYPSRDSLFEVPDVVPVSAAPAMANSEVPASIIESFAPPAEPPHGWCPICADAIAERRDDGFDICERGHEFPSNLALVSVVARVELMASRDAKPTPVYGQFRMCFTDNKLSGVMLLNEDQSCDTPACGWTTTQMPLTIEGVLAIRIGMDMLDYLRMCGVDV